LLRAVRDRGRLYGARAAQVPRTLGKRGSQVGEQALKFFGQLYEVERTVSNADSQARLEARRAARPLADALNQWLRQQRQRVPDGSATARAIDYSLKRWRR